MRRNLIGAVLAFWSMASSACDDSVITGDDAPGDVDLTEYVQTPQGFYHRSCVHDLGNGAGYDDESATVTDSDGTTHQLPDCRYPYFASRADAIAQTGDQDLAYAAGTTGWITTGTKRYTPAYRSFDSWWIVPPAPTRVDRQLIYFFPGLQPAGAVRILQPVLQYGANGAFGGHDWTIASWSCGSGRCPHSTPVKVSVGDSIHGTIVGSMCSAFGACDWTIKTRDVTSGVETVLHWHASLPYTDAFAALEAYNVETCDEYPAQGSLFLYTALDRLNGYLGTGDWRVISWPQSPACDAHADSINHRGVTIHWTH